MEEKNAAPLGGPETKPDTAGDRGELTVPDSIWGNAKAVFTYWQEKGLEPSKMLQRVMELYDSDPRSAEALFGEEFMDTIDYFTHYWN